MKHGDGTARSQALKDGAAYYLLKPFREESSLQAIHAALNLKWLRRRAQSTLTVKAPIREKEDESYSARVGPALLRQDRI